MYRLYCTIHFTLHVAVNNFHLSPHSPTVDAGVRTVNSALDSGDPDQTLAALQCEDLDIPDLYPENKEYYQGGLLAMKQAKGGGSLTEEEIKAGVKEMNEKAEYDRSGESWVGEGCKQLGRVL